MDALEALKIVVYVVSYFWGTPAVHEPPAVKCIIQTVPAAPAPNFNKVTKDRWLTAEDDES